MKHRLVVLGWMGMKIAYLDLSEEEARAKYEETYGLSEDEPVKVVEFTDYFGAYDIYEAEPEGA